jgi:aerobic-type carbon monoxide dehydrogenase small subunit (CoxS/CutS family)
VAVADGISLLDALREELGCRSVKDGCSPQGQCGCCTVWVDGAPRVSCVTPVRRIAGRQVTTLEGLDEECRRRWADAFVSHGASQCGFCTPGIIMRLAALEESGGPRAARRREVESGLRAHLCRCTGWQSIVEAACDALGADDDELRESPSGAGPPAPRNQLLASWRSQTEGPAFQSSGPDVVLGGGGFADDAAPLDALVQLGAAAPLARGLRAARAASGRVQGRNSTVPLTHPVDVAPGEWALTLQTTWVEPAYVEPDASWCRPGRPPATPLANGGAFGGKRHSQVPVVARDLASAEAETVRVLWRREDVVRRGPKRPPVAVALRADGTGIVRLGHTPGSADLSPLARHIVRACPGIEVELVAVAGPPVAPDLRAAGWGETLAAVHALRAEPTAAGRGRVHVVVPGAGSATVDLRLDEGERGRVAVDVWAGAPACPVTLRSYALGAVHQALGLVWSEGIAVDVEGGPLDLTIRSFGILAARDMPEVDVRVHDEEGWPVNGSDAVFVATLAAAWIAEGVPGRWPTRRAAVRAPRRDVAPSSG